MNSNYFCFVLMPFDQKFEDVYNLGIKASAREAGVTAERVDEQTFSETILERIYSQIKNCDFVIADMTGRNANVFYEVGYAHALGKLCILLTENSEDIPFDLKHHRHVVYEGSVTNLKKALEAEISWAKTEVDQQRQQAYRVSFRKGYGFLEKSDWRVMGTFATEIQIHNTGSRRGPEIDAVYLYTSEHWSFENNEKECSYQSIDQDRYAKKHLFMPEIKRIPKGNEVTIKAKALRTFWTRFDETGDPEDKYESKGNVRVEIVTEGESFFYDFQLDVTFEEMAF